MKLDTLEKLYVDELRDIYNAENQLLKALPKMAKGSSSPDLKSGFEKHLRQTETHVQRLDQIFAELDESPKGKTCRAMKGLIEEGSEILKEEGEESVLDAGIIVAAQKVEHYEMAAYGSARTFARLLGQDKAAELLQTTLDEESETNESLNQLAENMVNPEALIGTELGVPVHVDNRQTRHSISPRPLSLFSPGGAAKVARVQPDSERVILQISLTIACGSLSSRNPSNVACRSSP